MRHKERFKQSEIPKIKLLARSKCDHAYYTCDCTSNGARKLKDHCRHTGLWAPFLIVYILFYLLWTENKVKNILFPSILIRIRQNIRKFVKDCLVIRWIVKLILWCPRQNGRQQEIEIMDCDHVENIGRQTLIRKWNELQQCHPQRYVES